MSDQNWDDCDDQNDPQDDQDGHRDDFDQDGDESMDGDFDTGMASAGWGCDEDYGGYND